jgi:quercetin dioxygenase-like cupin family protein
MNIQAFEASLQVDGYDEITTVEKPAAYQMGDHKHPFDACALITLGDITIAVNGVASRYRVDDIFRLPAHTVHTEAAGPEGVVYRVGRRHVVSP